MISILSVSEATGYLREVLESDDVLQDLWVRGEVSNCVQSQAGHVYFTLKDDAAQLRCVIFRSQLASLGYRPQNGIAVIAHGRLSYYEAGGQVQLYVDVVQPQGVGALFLQFERLRRRLEEEGLFDPARKRPLPRFPRRIGLVTSPTAAAMYDVLRTLAHRFPAVEVILAPTLVQGEEAPSAIVAALGAVNQVPDLDVVIVARGGGSLEDLWAFNDERVARAIFASRAPVVVGVGHETDVTIADLVADVRAPTPTAAATLVVPDRREYLAQVEDVRRRAALAVGSALEASRRRLAQAHGAVRRLLPPPRILRWRQQVDELDTRSAGALRHAVALWHERLRSRRLQLAALSPAAVLARGYSISWHLGTGRAIKSVAQVATGDGIQIQVADGFFLAEVGSPPGVAPAGLGNRAAVTQQADCRPVPRQDSA